MKAPQKSKVKKHKIKKPPIDKSKKEQVLVVAQEFKFARSLSGNEKRTRDKVLKTLKKWLLSCFEKGYEFKEDDFIRVWKGLFYAVWMSDKPLVQEELCESIAEILDLFPPEQLKYGVMMTKAGLKVLATEWYGIDQHRMDKFLMLVRRYLRGSLRCLMRCDWSLDSCRKYSKMLMSPDGILCVNTPQYAKNAMSMILHVIDCFLEELAKVSNGKIPEASIAELMYPFTSLVCSGGELVLCVAARRLLTALLRQSEQGLLYQEATRAWQKMGCPAGGPEALEMVSDDEEVPEPNADDDHIDEPKTALDPRAGRVNVYLPLLPVPAAQIASQLKKLMTKASSKAYKRAKICLERFETLSKNVYPLAVEEVDMSGMESPLHEATPTAAEQLCELDKMLVSQSDELALRGLKRKHRKRLLAKSRAGLSIIDDVQIPTNSKMHATIGEWQIEDIKLDSKEKMKKVDSSNKENQVVMKKANRKRKLLENGQHEVKKTKNLNTNVSETKVSNTGKENDKSNVKNNKVETIEKHTDKIKKDTLVNGDSKKAKKDKLGKDSKQKVVKNVPKLIENDKLKKQKDVHKESKELSNAVVNKDSQKPSVSNFKPQKMSKVNSKPVMRQKVLPINKIKNYQKQISPKNDKKVETPRKKVIDGPKRVKFVLKNNSMQGTVDYFKSVRQSPNIPFDSSKKPSKTNLKPSTPSPINPFFKKKLKMKF